MAIVTHVSDVAPVPFCSNTWTQQRTTIFTDKWISAAVIQRLQDQFIQNWQIK